jgi:hypothetical protein
MKYIIHGSEAIPVFGRKWNLRIRAVHSLDSFSNNPDSMPSGRRNGADNICEEDRMENEKIFGMYFAKVYPMLIARAERKGRTKDEVDGIASWLIGYSSDAIRGFLHSDLVYGDFFRQAPALNPGRRLIRGTVCGVRVENIEDSLMQEIRYLDKLVDELAKGKKMEQILRK